VNGRPNQSRWSVLAGALKSRSFLLLRRWHAEQADCARGGFRVNGVVGSLRLGGVWGRKLFSRLDRVEVTIERLSS